MIDSMVCDSIGDSMVGDSMAGDSMVGDSMVGDTWHLKYLLSCIEWQVQAVMQP